MNHVCPDCGTVYGGPGACRSEGAVLAPQDDPLLGQVIGSYRITRVLGAGGMGRVYRAIQPSIGARVAIKVLSGECARERDLVDRFFAEARAVNLIRHESIVNVMDLAFLPDGRPFIVMEYLDGAPLSAVIRQRGPLPLGATTELIVEVLDALAAAHARGIVHRDLKPDNIFVTPAGHAQVLDFGIAKLDSSLTTRHGSTRAGSLLGTPPYMSPEQATARPADARSDLYGVGVILFEMVTGRLPFVSDVLFELLRMHIETPPPRPSSLRPDLPPAMEAVILRALAKDPAQRFASAPEMSTALLEAAQAVPPAAWGTLRMTESGAPEHNALTPRAARMSSAMGQGSAPGQFSLPAPTPPAKRAGSKAILFALGALLLVGAGATVALVVKGGGKSNAAVVPPAAPPPPEAPPPPPSPPPVVVANPDAGPAVDTKNFDAVAWLPQAQKLAQKHHPDAQLTRIIMNNVRVNGLSDLTLTKYPFVKYEFRSPSASRRGDKPEGIELDCVVHVFVTAYQGVNVEPRSDAKCEDKIIGPPHCRPADIWQKALSNGAHENAVADVQWMTDFNGRTKWMFSIGTDDTTSFDDDCRR